MSSPPLRVLNERYRLDAAIGKGGMGVVYRATDLHLERPVAVKMIAGVESKDAALVAERFVREVKATARVRHPNIVEVFDVGDADGDPYFVMELLEGKTLAEVLQLEGALSLRRALDVVIEACEGLAAAHEAGLVHRDVKPANLMLAKTGASTTVKVLDFGVAHVLGRTTELTREGALVGTVEYMAPEQILGETVDARADVYSLGAVLYRAISGKPLFDVESTVAMIHAHVNASPQPLDVRASQTVPAGIAATVAKALAKRREDRFETMHAFARALRGEEPTLRGESPAKPVDAPPPRPAPGPAPDLDLPARPVAARRASGSPDAVPWLPSHDNKELEIDPGDDDEPPIPEIEAIPRADPMPAIVAYDPGPPVVRFPSTRPLTPAPAEDEAGYLTIRVEPRTLHAACAVLVGALFLNALYWGFSLLSSLALLAGTAAAVMIWKKRAAA